MIVFSWYFKTCKILFLHQVPIYFLQYLPIEKNSGNTKTMFLLKMNTLNVLEKYFRFLISYVLVIIIVRMSH